MSMQKLFDKLYILTSTLVALTGIYAIARIHIKIGSIESSNLFSVDPALFNASRIASIGLGFLLIYFALQLFRRKRRAWQIAVLIIAVLIILSLVHPHYLVRTLWYLGALIILLISRRSYNVRSENLSLRRGVGISILVIIGALAYGAIGFYLLEKREFAMDFNAKQSIEYAVLQMTFRQSSVPLPNTEYARLFLDSLNMVSITAATIAAFSLFKPIRFATANNKREHDLAEKIIRNNSSSVEDFFKLWPSDKHYFFSKKEDAVLAYKVSGGTALVLDGPTGKSSSFGELLNDFNTFVKTQGWLPAIIHANKDLGEQTKKLGYKCIYIGSEAIVDVAKFAETTYRSKHFRYISNKAKREGLSVELWEAPLSDSQVSILRTISSQWIGMAGRREYTFVMGYFDDSYLRSCDVAVLKHGTNFTAYSNLIPSFVVSERSIDHMRHTPTMPSVGMHYLLKELILDLAQKDIKEFNLGLSPLSGIDERADTTIPERILRLIKNVGSRYYSFKGLEQFKNKFEPEWAPRFIYYDGNPTNLLKITSSLNSAVAVPRKGSLLRKKLVYGFGLIAAISYVSFPLGYILGSNNGELVSQLGADGAAYASIFNFFDVVSGFAIAGTGFLLLYKRSVTGREKLAMSAYVVGGLGGMFAALFSLPNPNHIDFSDSETMIHAILSSLNVGGIILAATLVTWLFARKTHFIVGLFVGYIILSIASVILEQTTVGPIVQRLQIITTGVWIFVIAIELFKVERLE